MKTDKIIDILEEFKVYEEIIQSKDQVPDGAIDYEKIARNHAMRRIAIRIIDLFKETEFTQDIYKHKIAEITEGRVLRLLEKHFNIYPEWFALSEFTHDLLKEER